MRPIIYHVATTLDNFICHKDGSINGFLPEGDHIPDYLQCLQQYDTVIMGRNTYEFGYQFGMKPGQAPYPHMQHFIFSKTLQIQEPLDEKVNIIRDDAIPFVKRLKESEGKPIYLCGGAAFAASLFEHELIDRLTIKLNPALFGTGMRLFENSAKAVNLELLETKTYTSGVLLIAYKINYT